MITLYQYYFLNSDSIGLTALLPKLNWYGLRMAKHASWDSWDLLRLFYTSICDTLPFTCMTFSIFNFLNPKKIRKLGVIDNQNSSIYTIPRNLKILTIYLINTFFKKIKIFRNLSGRYEYRLKFLYFICHKKQSISHYRNIGVTC